MKKRLTAILTLMALFTCAGSLYAAGDAKQESDTSQNMGVSQSTQSPDMQSQDMNRTGNALDQPTGALQSQANTAQIPSADKLEGMEVFSPDGEKIGKISEVQKDQLTGNINYVTVSKGGIFGFGSEDAAVPLGAFRFDTDRAILTVDQGKLESAPEQADVSDEQFQRDLQNHYGVSPVWQQDSGKIDSKSTDSLKESTPTQTPASGSSLKN